MREKIQKGLESNIWKLKLFQMVGAFVLFLPIIILFWQGLGLSMTQIMLLQSLFAVTVVIMEIPTGYFADVFGRKKALVISSFFIVAATSTYAIGTNFYHFLIGEILFGVGMSLISGSDSALLYDTLTELKRKVEFKKIWGQTIFLLLVSVAVANVLGGFIGNIDFRLTFYIVIPIQLLLIPISLSVVEPKRHKRIFKKGYFFELLTIIKEDVLKHKKLRWLIIYTGIVYAFNQSALWFYQPYFSLSGLDIIHFGLVFASFQLIAAFSSKYAHKIEEKLGEKYSLIMLVFLTGVSFLLMSNFVYLFSFTFAFLQQFVRGFSKIVVADYIHKLTKSDVRATVMSVQSMFGQLIYAIIIPFAGYISDVFSLLQALTVLGVTILLIGVILIIILYRNKVFT